MVRQYIGHELGLVGGNPMIRRTKLLWFVALAVVAWHSSGATLRADGPTEQEKLKDLLRLATTSENKWKEESRCDFDGDGTPDAVVESTQGRGPLSTYYVTYRLRALPGTRFLQDGRPLPLGSKVRVA